MTRFHAGAAVFLVLLACSPPYSELERHCMAEAMETIYQAKKAGTYAGSLRVDGLEINDEDTVPIFKRRVFESVSLNGCPAEFLQHFDRAKTQVTDPAGFDAAVTMARQFVDQVEQETGPLPKVEFRGDPEVIQRDPDLREWAEIVGWQPPTDPPSLEEMVCVRRVQKSLSRTDAQFAAGDYEGSMAALLRNDLKEFGGCPQEFIDLYGVYLKRVGELGFGLAGGNEEAAAKSRRSVLRYGRVRSSDAGEGAPAGEPEAGEPESPERQCVATAQRRIAEMSDQFASDMKARPKGSSDKVVVEALVNELLEISLDHCPFEFIALHADMVTIWEDYLLLDHDILDEDIRRLDEVAKKLYAFEVEGG